jgi:hypothetical protein
MTLGRSVFFGRVYWQEYKKKTAFGISIAGHEVRHVLDFRKHGFGGFLAKYLAGWVSAGFSYGNNKWEKMAEAAEVAIYAMLLRDDQLLQSIQDSTYSPGTIRYHGTLPSERFIQPVTPGVFGGMSFLSEFEGELWIDGINLTGVLNQSRGGGL